MPEQPFDVRKVIEQSASKTTLQELAKKGIHRVKVLDEQMINKLIHEAVEHIIGTKTNLLSDTDREKLVQQSRQELDKLVKEFNQVKERSDLLTQDKNTLAAEVENLQRQLQLQRQLTDQIGKQSLEQGKAFAKTEIEMLQKRLELKEQELDMARRQGGPEVQKRTEQHLQELTRKDEQIRELTRRVDEALTRGAQQKEAELSQRIMAEMQKNVDLSTKLTKTLEDMRVRDDEIAKKMEQLFTKSIEGISKKLTDLRLRSIAGAGAGVAGGPSEDAFRQSADVIAHMLGNELESNIEQMKPTEGKTAGKLGSALERLKAMRSGQGGAPAGGEQKEGDKK